jgi:hypothetical protein
MGGELITGLHISATAGSLSASGTPGESYELQASTNLNDWIIIESAVAQPDGSLQFLEILPPITPRPILPVPPALVPVTLCSLRCLL